MKADLSSYANRTRFKNRLIKISLLLLLILILLFPSEAFAGARNGLLLWWDTLLPTLLPFMIISNLIVKLRITKLLSTLLYPIFRWFIPISRDGCYSVFIGFLAGYPVGAKTTADLRQNRVICTKEAQMLCAFCNNASPMFVLSYITAIQLSSPKLGVPLLIILYLSSYLSAMIWYKFISKKDSTILPRLKATATEDKLVTTSPKFEFTMLDEAILSAFEVVTKVGGYIVLFSVLASFITNLPVPYKTPIPYITGVIEITTGIHNISCLPISTDMKLVSIAAITAFGGLSGFAQTKSVISGCNLSSAHYLICKIISTGIAIVLALGYVFFF
ncbi:MAG: transporter [Clostridiales bacterium]|nr:transporter [Clostridiales bacterium]